eukprot:4283845-Heterocapsa_arctica.AAC.1
MPAPLPAHGRHVRLPAQRTSHPQARGQQQGPPGCHDLQRRGRRHRVRPGLPLARTPVRGSQPQAHGQ